MKAVTNAILMLALLLAGCGKPPAEEYAKKAEEAAKGGLWSVAIQDYQDLVKYHPESAEAENACVQHCSH